MDQPIKEAHFKHWEEAINSIGDLLVLVNFHGSVLWTNQAVERWNLAPVNQAPGMDVHRLLHRECDDPSCYLLRLWSRLAEDSKGKKRLETELKDPHLNRWIHLTLELLPEDKGQDDDPDEAARASSILTVRDITESYDRRTREARRTRFEAQQVIARSLAHEIGNPLASMQTTTEVLAENINRFEPTKVDTYLSRILEGTQRLQAIVERVLREHSSTEFVLESVSIETLLERMRRLFEDDMLARGLQFELMPRPSSPPPLVSVELTAVEEVLVNVLRNALEATPASGSIFLGFRCEKGRVLVVVRDTGRGMDRDQVVNAFQPFFTTKRDGLGFGLAYSNYLMRKMGGRIVIDSQVEQGTSVTLEFPIATNPLPSPDDSSF